MALGSRWLALLLMTRLLGAGAAALLLVIHEVTPHDPVLLLVLAGYTAASLAAFARIPRLQDAPVAWAVDGAAVLALILASEDWRSPFYVYALTALILPATSLPFRRAIAWGAGFTAAYLAIAVRTELDGRTLESAIRLETIATHLMVPLVVVLALAYASEVLARLREERVHAERLAVEAERQRIAWELHDSAKQRVHAAHLVLSALRGRLADGQGEIVEHALGELRAATADMDTSVAELRMPLDGRPVERLLHDRAAELARVSDALIEVHGSVGPLPPLVAAHSYRIAAEALTNAVRHGGAARIDVRLHRHADGATIAVSDDGAGMPEHTRPGSNGLRSMASRAETIGAVLAISAGADGRGTRVCLELPDSPPPGGTDP